MNSVTIQKATGATAALGSFIARGVDFASGARIEADGSIKAIIVQDIGGMTDISITGSLGSLSARNIGGGFNLAVTDDLVRLAAFSMGTNANISAGDRIAALGVTRGIVEARINAGAAGIGTISLGCLKSSVIAAVGSIGGVRVNGDMHASSIAANIGAGANGKYGESPTDDVVLDSSLVGAIRSLTVRGKLEGSSDPSNHFGIVADGQIGRILVGGRRLLPTVLGNITIAANWR